MGVELTNEQKKIVYSNCKINIGLATPGSGKTTVLTTRAERLWNETREPILIVTFSNDACESIQKKILPETKVGITIKTIHGFCYDIVKEYWKDLGEILAKESWPPSPSLITKEQELELIQELFPDEGSITLYEKFLKLREFCTTPDVLLRFFKKKVYFEKVQQKDIEKLQILDSIRLSRGLINFDDMISLAEILIPLPYIAVDINRRFAHVLIDEAQDTSDQQWRILRPLVLNSSTSLVVGDVNQSIYGFRNADGSILNCMNNMRDAVSFRLSKSFRSGVAIADLANKICPDKNSQIIPEGHLGKVSIYKFEDKASEVSWVLKNIEKGTAILSRTNAYLADFERACIENEIQYGGKSFYRAPHIRSLYKFLKCYSGNDLAQIIQQAFVKNSSFSKLEADDFRLVIEQITKEGVSRFFNLVELSQILEGNEVILTTGHASKGLEWDNVVVVGCHNGHIPHKYSTDMVEEKNLLYVMTSRARDNLLITAIGEPSIFLPQDSRKGAIKG